VNLCFEFQLFVGIGKHLEATEIKQEEHAKLARSLHLISLPHINFADFTIREIR
jgi:hypothetical protein